MKIVSSNELEDYLINQLYIASKSKRINRNRRINRFIIPLLYLGVSIFGFLTDDTLLASIFLIISIVWLLGYPKYSRNRYKKHYEKHIIESQKQNFGREITIEILDEFLKIADELNETKLSYKEIKEIVELKNNFLVSLNYGGNIILNKETEKISDFITQLEKIISKDRVVEIDWVWK